MHMGPGRRRRLVDFTLELDEEDAGLLEEVVATWKIENINMMTHIYSLSYIRSLGTPLYQLNFVRRLVHFFKSNEIDPMGIWESILANPSEYLDPTIYIPRDREMETAFDDFE